MRCPRNVQNLKFNALKCSLFPVEKCFNCYVHRNTVAMLLMGLLCFAFFNFAAVHVRILRAVGFKKWPGHETSKTFHGGEEHKGVISLSKWGMGGRGFSPEKIL